MKKFLLIGGGIVALAAAGWSGLWFLGRGEIEQRLDAEAARMQARGWTLTWGERAISGFPFGYDVRMTDVAAIAERNGYLLRIGDVTTRADADNPDRIITTLPPRIELTLPVPNTARVNDPDLPERFTVVVESTDLVVAAEGLDPIERAIDVVAGTISVTVAQEDFPYRLSMSASDMALGIEGKPEGLFAVLRSGQMATGFAHPAAPDQPSIDYTYQNLAMTVDIAARSLPRFVEQLAARAEGLIDGTSTATAQTLSLTTQGGPAGDPASVTYAAGAHTGLFGLSGGKIRYQAEDREVTMTFDGFGPAAMTTRAEAYQRDLTLPLAHPDGTPQDGALRVALVNMLSETPTFPAETELGARERLPAQMVLDVLATLSYRRNGTGGVPVAFSNVTVQEWLLEALGASARLSGDVEILQPINLPQGRLDIEVTGAKTVMGALRSAGVLPEQMRRMGEAMLQVYAKPGEGEDAWVSDLTFDFNGVSMNGLKLPGQ